MSPVLLAHAAHWALYVLYAVPVLIVLIAVGKAFLDQRRERRADPDRAGQPDQT